MRGTARATTSLLATVYCGQAAAFVTQTDVATRDARLRLSSSQVRSSVVPPFRPRQMSHVPVRFSSTFERSPRKELSSSLEQNDGETNVCPFGRFFDAVRSFPLVRSARRLLSTLFIAFALIMGMRIGRWSLPPAHASAPTRTTTSSSLTTRVTSSYRPLATATATSSPRVERLIERYVQEHMFNDDKYDPFESAYREAHYDEVAGVYPDSLDAALSEASVSATGEGRKPVTLLTPSATSRGPVILRRIDKFLRNVESRYGISRLVTFPIFTITTVVFTLYLLVYLFGVLSASLGRADRAKTVARYGDAAGLDATELRERQIAEEDDEEDDDDDEDDDDEDD